MFRLFRYRTTHSGWFNRGAGSSSPWRIIHTILRDNVDGYPEAAVGNVGLAPRHQLFNVVLHCTARIVRSSNYGYLGTRSTNCHSGAGLIARTVGNRLAEFPPSLIGFPFTTRNLPTSRTLPSGRVISGISLNPADISALSKVIHGT